MSSTLKKKSIAEEPNKDTATENMEQGEVYKRSVLRSFIAARRQTATYRRTYGWWYGRRQVTLSKFQETEEERVP